MAKRRWAAATAVRAFDLRIGLRATDTPTFRQALEYLPPCREEMQSPVVDRIYSLMSCRATAGIAQKHRLYAGPRRLLETTNREDLFDFLEGHAGLYVAERSPTRVFVHAGVVGWRGQAILIPGRSFSGKSTLVAALLRAGATCHSDEFAVVDEEGSIHPFPRRLSLRRPSDRPFRCGPEHFGSSQGKEPLRAGLVVLTRHEPGRKWRPRPISPARALLALVRHTVPVRRRPEFSLFALRRMLAGARALVGARDEADEVAGDLLNQLGQ